MSPTLSLIICTYRRPDDLGRLLAALRDQTAPPDEVLIIDGSPDEETATKVRAGGDWGIADLRYLHVAPEDRGLTRQRNVGISEARGEILAFVDDDTVPESDYFAAIRACFVEHPQAAGVGGYVTGTEWRPVPTGAARPTLARFRFGGWERRDEIRWRLRRLLGLDSPAPPGRMAPSGHGRSLSYLPPDGEDYRVDFLVGCAMAFRRSLFDHLRFSAYFEGYGLYEDLDFSTRALGYGELILCGAARIAHYHAPAGRPNLRRYGRMVVENGWRVWRGRWPRPPWRARFRWWAVTYLLIACRVVDAVRGRPGALADAIGRFEGGLRVLVRGGAGRDG